MSLLHSLLLQLLLISAALSHPPPPSFSNELSRCCSGGSRHFHQTNTCSSIRSEGTSMTCVRSASICCLRSLLDSSCEEGASLARQDQSCPVNINVLGGGLRKECCDCCLLAKDMVARNEPCVPPTGFSAACLRAFSRCCAGTVEFTQAHQLITEKPSLDGAAVLHLGDRCSTSKCDHLCNDRGGDSVECSCREGFELGPDGTSCVDVDECQLLADDCLESQRCLNTPGSFKCIRTLSCGTGYALDSDTEQCMDVDECNLGAHDCGPLYQCRNTQGSYRCDPKKCGEGELQNPQTGECTSIDCPQGFYPKDGMCHDVDECASTNRCRPSEECINTRGSFRCQQRDSLCAPGYTTNPDTGFCDDINECDSSICGSLQCTNLPGSFRCRCPAGYDFNDETKRCEDIDECSKFLGHVCDTSAECVNTIGSFLCRCNQGFKLTDDGRHCQDINECETGVARCEQKCVNIPGSYQCICDRGFALDNDGLACSDIDECAIWAGSGSDLCMGGCVNTRGSYLCQCPPGYKIQPDGRTCVDVDECALGECQGSDRICVNTLGHFECHRVECPPNYMHDKKMKNRCVRDATACASTAHRDCSSLAQHISWQFIAIPKAVPISSHRPSITLFTIKGPAGPDASVQFELQLVEARPGASWVQPAIRTNFLLQKGKDRNSAVIALRDSLDGPQMVDLRLILRLSKKGGRGTMSYEARLVVHVASHKRHSTALPSGV